MFTDQIETRFAQTGGQVIQVLSISPEIKEAVAYHIALRRLGFESDNIFFLVVPDGKTFRAGMLAKHEGKEFVIDIGASELSDTEMTEAWKSLSESINDFSISDKSLEDIWTNSKVYQYRKLLIDALITKGMTPWHSNEKETKLLD